MPQGTTAPIVSASPRHPRWKKSSPFPKGHFAGPMCDVCGGVQVYMFAKKNHPLIVATDFGGGPHFVVTYNMSHLMIIWLKSSLHRCSSKWPCFPRWCRSFAPSMAEGPNRGGFSVIFGVVKTEGQDASYALGPAKPH